jgi:hypothetical protein
MKATATAAALALLFAGAAQAAPDPTEAEPVACTLPSGVEDNPMADRSGTLAKYEQLPTACLKEVVLQCGQVANRVLLDPGSAAICSYGYEALLRRGFGGDFGALVSWWRGARDTSLQ